ncbi:Protein abnormal spindle [Eumeta japonica]|uniref:Protein abnormal spindle n=1 Tax=Eumeta variegata TaxID=151549 RepID=A0A4C1SAL0_EUMVA|nr:Protein abnormal spindle [Eumeta japonica]
MPKRKSNELSFSDSQSMDSLVSGSSTASLRTTSIKSNCAMSPPKRQKLEERILICPSKLHLVPQPRLDPFAATTTCDPFLASTMYLDEASVEKHEIEFKKWLNALVTMPADLDTDSNAKIDVGKLFNEVRHKELVLAPTKEEQSINYLTNLRLESLRKAAVELFLSEEMRVPCSKLAVYIQKNSLRIRSDRNLHLDVVTQREILELLLSFNPLWLRLGLEVIYGEKFIFSPTEILLD